MKTTVIAVVGTKNSGKTTVIEILTKELVKRGYRLAVAKHIPEPNFTINTEGKDTWRFAEAGAETIVSVASDEIVTVEKTDTRRFSLEAILQRCKSVDLVFLEGFKKLVGGKYDVPKIVTIKSSEEAVEASKTFEPILAFAGLHSVEMLNLNIPYINVLEGKDEIVNMVEENVRK
ncbi:molybdopterin-guanine dinucleotide biosynthesis protein B [Candidatus Bathyarchaeota archaeon]|nr:MAG: molybdopterin-guanine dinucleotide biosynthesis protein B [Candidatus Bathyarchaeota archaeon]